MKKDKRVLLRNLAKDRNRNDNGNTRVKDLGFKVQR